MLLIDRIREMIAQAKERGIPARRLYVGQVKMEQLDRELHGYISISGPCLSEGQTVCGLKVVLSSKPGMSVGL